MYIVNTAITANFILLTGSSPPALSDLDIRIKKPDGTVQYINSAITSANYTPSTSTTKGFAKYNFTPDSEGVWTIGLHNGTAGNNAEYHTYTITIVKAKSYTKKFIKQGLI